MFDKYVAEFRTNVRLRLLFAGVIAIVWFYTLINLRDLAIAKNQQFIGVERQIAKTKLQASEADWPQRLQSIKLLKVELEGRLWQNSTQGLAQAAFQDWLNQAAIRATLARPAVSMLAVEDKSETGTADAAANPASSNPELWKVRAKLEFDFTPPGLMNLLKQITMNPQQVVVESLNIRKEPVPRVDMLLVANFQKTAKK
jgi:septal ring-binding cell division protein DamX